MKILSDETVTKDNLQKVDDKHGSAIFKLQIALGVCTFINLFVTLALKYFA